MKRLLIFIMMIVLILSCKKVYIVNCTGLGSKYDVNIKGADMQTFKCINQFYGKDKKFVYSLYGYKTKNYDFAKKVRSADPKSFENIGNYYKDKNNVYHRDTKIIGADPSTFQKLNNFYYRDKNSIYNKGNKLKQADILTFKVLDDSYAKDKNNVYYCRKK